MTEDEGFACEVAEHYGWEAEWDDNDNCRMVGTWYALAALYTAVYEKEDTPVMPGVGGLLTPAANRMLECGRFVYWFDDEAGQYCLAVDTETMYRFVYPNGRPKIGVRYTSWEEEGDVYRKVLTYDMTEAA